MTLSVRDQKILGATGDTDEPIFILRAKDILSVMALKEYERLVEAYGPEDYDFQADLVERISAFKTWQHANVSKVKLPD